MFTYMDVLEVMALFESADLICLAASVRMHTSFDEQACSSAERSAVGGGNSNEADKAGDSMAVLVVVGENRFGFVVEGVVDFDFGVGESDADFGVGDSTSDMSGAGVGSVDGHGSGDSRNGNGDGGGEG